MHLESRTAKFLQHWYPQICKFGLKTTQRQVPIFEVLSQGYHSHYNDMAQLVEQSSVTFDQMISKRHKIILENLYMPES